ncbi:hypothetical protein K3495_g16333, partial [Podosphaera aphanis]
WLTGLTGFEPAFSCLEWGMCPSCPDSTWENGPDDAPLHHPTRMERLTNTEKGLSPVAMRQLYLACIISISDYASQVWWKRQRNFVEMLEKLQNIALRKILGCFKTSPTKAMELEACLCPPEVRLNHYRRKYAMRSLELMQNHPVARALAENRIFHHANMDNDDICHSEGIRDQLRSINKSIPAEVDIRNLEVISNRNYPPWKRNLPYTVKIGKLPKEEEVLLHQAKVTKLKGSSTIVYYTDASFYAEATGIGQTYNNTHYHNSPIYRSKFF